MKQQEKKKQFRSLRYSAIQQSYRDKCLSCMYHSQFGFDLERKM